MPIKIHAGMMLRVPVRCAGPCGRIQDSQFKTLRRIVIPRSGLRVTWAENEKHTAPGASA